MEEACNFIIKCKQCGNYFEAKGANAAYCSSCRAERKKMLDHKAWIRRKHKDNAYTVCEKRKIYMQRLEKTHAKELGIDETYYYLWRDCNPVHYKRWMYSHLPPELVPDSFLLVTSKDSYKKQSILLS